jgi:hypothetical protein
LSVLVDSVSILNINGMSLKVLHISYPILPYEWGYDIVAGIGNTFFLTPDWGLYEGGPMGLRCFSVGDTTFHFVPYPCDTAIIISNVEQFADKPSVISISPNPFSDNLQIQVGIPIRNASFLLYNQAGQVLQNAAISEGANRISLPPLPPGLYFWKATSGDGSVWSGKVVRE